jgi:hypothetical protein
MSNSVNDDAEISAAMAAATVDTSEVEEESKVRKVTKEGTQGRRAVKASAEAPRMESKKIGGDSYVARTSNPPWLEQRKQVYDMISERRLKESLEFQRVPIYVTLPNGDILRENSKTGLPYEAWRTSPFDVAATISQGLADAAVVARVTYADFVPDYSLSQDGMDTVDTMLTDVDASEEWEEDEDEAKTAAPVISTTVGTFLWDMTRPLVGNVAKMEFLKFEEDPDARTVFWHSSAHMLGEALEHLFGCRLTIGPPLAGGFYYDSYMGMESFSDADCKLENYKGFVYCIAIVLYVCLTSIVTLSLYLQINLLRKRCRRFQNRNKPLNEWLLQRKRLCNFFRVIHSRNRSFERKYRIRRGRRFIAVETSLTSAEDRTCRIQER